ncbi:hypothetical protein [Sinorhizobium meliloti]|uniref:hypothetical protein n=1 Tax=Rhizobium meliloti TaxID=382 RepID=UPI001F303C24|nr:hypothetical protein [Sinorhizobium meliloti]
MRLNKVKARGKWYVYLRDEKTAIIRGFDGSETDLEKLIAEKLEAHREPSPMEKARYRAGWRMEMARYLHKVTKARANRRSLAYDLSIESIFDRLQGQTDACEVTGIPFVYTPKDSDAGWHRRPFAPSIDRKDNRFAYTSDNIRIVAVCVNISINEWVLAYSRRCAAGSWKGRKMFCKSDLFVSLSIGFSPMFCNFL